MKTLQEIKEYKNRKKLEEEVHQRKLKNVKEQICRSETPEEVEEQERYTKRTIELMNNNLDPLSYGFESGCTEDDASLVVRILKACNLYNEVIEKLNSKKGRFTSREAYVMMAELVDYLLDEYECTRKLMPTEHTYEPCDYHVEGRKLVFDPKEDFDVSSNKKWALGVIYYYLVTGYPALDNKHKTDFYNNIGLGPKVNTITWNQLTKEGHKFPAKEWQGLPKDVQECIKGLTCYHPGNRTLTEELGFHWCPCQDSDDSHSDNDSQSDDDNDSQSDDDTLVNQKAVDLSIDVASFKTIIDIQKKDMNDLRKEKAGNLDPEQKRRKTEWTSFFNDTKTKSTSTKKKKSDDAVDLSIDVASFKTIIDVQKQDMNDLRMEKARNTDPEHNLRKTEWTSFLSEAKKKSRKKKRSINSSKKKKEREENDESERKIQHWLNLYNTRLDSEEDYEAYNTAVIPFGAWGRVE